MDERPPREKTGGPDPDARKAERMAAALRANLARRKARKKSRATEPPADGKQG